MTQPILYTCPICTKSYATIQEAINCRDQTLDHCGLEVGTFVIIPTARLHWTDNSKESQDWLAFTEPPNLQSPCSFDHDISYHPWFVVTAIHAGKRRQDAHIAYVTVASNFVNGKFHHANGWNTANGAGHFSMLVPGLPMEQQRSIKGYAIVNQEYIMQNVLALQPSTHLKEEADKLIAKIGQSQYQL